MALTALTGSEELADTPTAVGLVQAARHDLDGSADPALGQLAGQLQQASLTIADVAAELSAFLSDLDADPARLQEVLARQAALRGLTRRYGEDVDAVLAWAREATAELENLDSSEHRLAELQTRLDALRAEVATAARALSDKRAKAASRLGGAGQQGTRPAGDGAGRRPGPGGAAGGEAERSGRGADARGLGAAPVRTASIRSRS